jgi:hypothetical protein
MDGFLTRLAQRAAGLPTSLPVWPSGPVAQRAADSLVSFAPLIDRDTPNAASSAPPMAGGITGPTTAPRHAPSTPRPTTVGVSPAPKPGMPDQPPAVVHPAGTAKTDAERDRAPRVLAMGEVPQRLDGREEPLLTTPLLSVPKKPGAPSRMIGDNGPRPRGVPHTRPERANETLQATPRRSSAILSTSQTVPDRSQGNRVVVEGAEPIAPIQATPEAPEPRSPGRPAPLLPRATATPPTTVRETSPAQLEEPGPAVEVHIGRIEVKVEPPPAQSAPAPRVTGFDAYGSIRTYADRNWY